MTREQFNTNWNNCFPKSYPIDYELKFALHDRWLRIHSLPESKRYPENAVEEQIILERQNQLIGDLLTDGARILIMIGFYSWNINDNDFDEYIDTSSYRLIDKIRLDQLDLKNKLEEETYYNIFIKEEFWRKNGFNDFLVRIANGETRGAIVSFDTSSIAVPYDGGIDLILPSKELKDLFKNKYYEWLSKRSDGL